MTNLVDAKQNQLDAKDRYRERRELARWEAADEQYDARAAGARDRQLDAAFGPIGGAR